jgi:tetratricopeptide (TPR) repeat protein
MNRTTIRVALLLALLVPVASAFAFPGRGGGGRGGGGGGGGMRGGGGGGFGGGGGGGMGGGGGFGGGGGGMGGGGFSHSPSISAPRPSPRPSPGGGGAGAGARPGGPQVGGGGRAPTAPGGSQFGNRPSTLPSGAGTRPAGAPGAAPGLGSRPGVGQPGVGRPGVGQPGVGRPGVGQAGVGQAGLANRPGVGQPGVGQVGVGQAGIANRPGVENRPAAAAAGNRAVVGGGNTINRGDVNVSGVRQNNVAGARVDPGYGVGRPAGDAYRGAYGNYHQGWVNGYWHGNHTNPSWNWGSFAVGAATGVTAWGLGSSMYSWGYAPYTNPYFASAAVAQPVAVAGGQPAAAPVAYDYSQPIDTQAPPPEPTVADQATATFDAAREAFKAGDYPRAQALADQALAQLPNDATLHEFRALCLFAQQQFEQAAVPLYAVLSVGPGWDWTTMIGLYPGVDVYTQQVRALEAYTKANPKSPAAPFVLAYHYLTQDHADAAVKELRQVVALSPADTLSAQLINQLTGGTPEAAAAPPVQPAPAPPPGTAPVAPGNLVGSWSASPAPDTTIGLTIQDGGAFAWKVTSKGKAQDITGDWSLANGVLTLARGGQGGAMVGNVSWLAPDKFTFRALGTGPGDSGLTFSR